MLTGPNLRWTHTSVFWFTSDAFHLPYIKNLRPKSAPYRTDSIFQNGVKQYSVFEHYRFKLMRCHDVTKMLIRRCFVILYLMKRVFFHRGLTSLTSDFSPNIHVFQLFQARRPRKTLKG